MNFDELFNNLISWSVTAGTRLIISLVILFVSFKIVNIIGRKIEKAGEKKKADKTIMRTLAYIFRLGVKILIVICLIGFVGINTSGFTALIASLGVGVGLAVNGALSNLAGGFIIILTRPFRIDDFIESQGYSGTVVDIHVTNTVLRTPDNKVVYVPNGPLSSGTIVNYSVKDTRRVDLIFSVSYSNDIEKAKSIIRSACEDHGLVLSDPAPFIRVSEHGASGVNITTRVWTKSEDYWTVRFDLLESVKAKFDADEIKIPYSQLDVHIKND